MTPRTGRPPAEDPKDITIRARMTAEDVRKLDVCCEYFDQTRSEVIRDGIERQYNFAYPGLNERKKFEALKQSGRTCPDCGLSEPEIRFSAKNKTCNACRYRSRLERENSIISDEFRLRPET